MDSRVTVKTKYLQLFNSQTLTFLGVPFIEQRAITRCTLLDQWIEPLFLLRAAVDRLDDSLHFDMILAPRELLIINSEYFTLWSRGKRLNPTKDHNLSQFTKEHIPNDKNETRPLGDLSCRSENDCCQTETKEAQS